MSADQSPIEDSAPHEVTGKRSLTMVLTLLIVVPGLLLLLAWFGFMTWNRSQVLARPFSTVIDASAGGTYADRQTYGIGLYGITDIGDIRIAVFGTMLLGGSTGGNIPIRPGADDKGSGRSGHDGRTVFERRTEDGQTDCVFIGAKFTIKDAVISFANREVKIGDGPKVVFLRKDGTVESVEAAKP